MEYREPAMAQVLSQGLPRQLDEFLGARGFQVVDTMGPDTQVLGNLYVDWSNGAVHYRLVRERLVWSVGIRGVASGKWHGLGTAVGLPRGLPPEAEVPFAQQMDVLLNDFEAVTGLFAPDALDSTERALSEVSRQYVRFHFGW